MATKAILKGNTLELVEANLTDDERATVLLGKIRAYMGEDDFRWMVERALRAALPGSLAMLGLATGDLSQLEDLDLLTAWGMVQDDYQRAQAAGEDVAQHIAAAEAIAAECGKRELALVPPVGIPVSIAKAQWTTAYINDLPDSAFLYVEAGGTKDADGKTVPRSKRHFPVKDKEGKVDRPHVTNAIARIPQSNAPGLDADKKAALQTKARDMLADLTKAAQAGGKPARTMKLAKADEERGIFYYVAVDADTPDADKEVLRKAEVERIAHDYMRRTGGRSLTINHGAKLNACLVETTIAKAACKIGTEDVKEGDWYVAVYVPDKEQRKVIKALSTGMSIGGYQLVEG